MNVKIDYLIEGAKKAQGVVVIIDVFRAFSLECYLINNHVEKIIPVASKEQAYQLKENNPEYILIGERGGVKLPGFDYGNSPSEIKDIDFAGKTVVHTTSAGTQGLEAPIHGDIILTGSLVNARAIADFIKKYYSQQEITLVSMGWNGEERTAEDDLCAEYLQTLLLDKEICILDAVADLRHSSGKKFFDKSQNHIFPEEDFWLCTDIHKFDFVLKYEKGKNETAEIVRC